MSNLRHIIAGASLGVVAFSASASAQATRTFVSGLGSDANPCSRTAPCQTFAGAISKTATGGEINCVDPGGFGAFTITKAITIDCTSTEAGILANGTNGVTINVAAPAVVTLAGLDIQGTGTQNGVNVLQVGTLHVRDTKIRGMGAGISFAPSGVAQMFVVDSSIANNGVGGGGGILVAPAATGAANVHVSRARIEGNFVGLKADGSISTIGVNVNMQDSLVSGNATDGVSAVSGAGLGAVNALITTSQISGNFGAGLSASGAGAGTVRVGGSMITANAVGIAASGTGQVRSHGNNQVAANTSGETFSGVDALK